MSELMRTIHQLLHTPEVRTGLEAALVMLSGLLGMKLLTRRLTGRKLAPQQNLLVRQVLRYGVLGASVVMALRVLGIDLSVLLGAAGVLTVAIGFASQTSASNLISGIFLMGEEPFVVGDVIRIGDVLGEVLSIGSLSVNLRTLDNLSIRIPNETVLKSNVVNLTRFPIRRFDLPISVAYREKLGEVRRVLLEVAENNPICLVEPKPVVLFKSYGDSSVNVSLMVWATKENYFELMSSIPEQVKSAFEANNIEIPFPQRTVRVVSDPEQRPRAHAEQDAEQQKQQTGQPASLGDLASG